ncbi:MAG: hypothetical protein RIB84_23880 [Sneathiellaceae bacterium]
MTAFDAAIDAVFADRNQAVDCTYTPVGGSALAGVRLILRDWDATGEAAGMTVRQSGRRGEVRRSEVATAAKGDAIATDDASYSVQSVRLDSAGVWQLGLRTS